MADDSSITPWIMLGVAIIAVPVVIGFVIAQKGLDEYILTVNSVGWTPGIMSNAGRMCRDGKGPEGLPLTAANAQDCRDLLAMVSNVANETNPNVRASLGYFARGYNA